MTDHTTPEQPDITIRLRKDKWHITGVDAEEAAQLIEDLREQLAKAKADERHIYQSFSSCDDERRTLSAELAQARAELEGLKAQGQWLPIESAPKDGVFQDGNNYYASHILAWWPGAIAPTRCRWWFRDDSDACNFLADGGYAVFPTVFRALPAPPTVEV